MNACCNILLWFITFVNTPAFCETNGYTLNVGTVLFSLSDLNKNHWSNTEIGLLRARKYFQSLIPPPNFINNLNEDYVDMLLDYFRDAYSLIKREATDPETDTILTSALSDAIGGYLKVWLLPVTKFAFYGGTVSQENALRLYRFYREMKNFMKTDGSGWRNPDPNLLSSVAINIVQPRRIANVRSMNTPCEHLAYYIKTPKGLSIPVPSVNWDDQSSTMFLPLKDRTLIPLESPNSTNSLFNYYDIAKTCMQTSSQDEQNQFDDRFQTWLADDVVPHLNDDNLYLALGSVLTLVNTTRSLCDTVIDLYGHKAIKSKSKFCISGIPIDLTSKKTMIIVIILFLEIAWCIPALLYIICKKKKKDRGSNVYLFVEPNESKKKRPKERFKVEKQGTRGKNKRKICESMSRVETSCGQLNNPGLKFTQKPRKNADTKCSSVIQNTTGTGAQSLLSSKNCSAEVARVIYDSPMNSLKPSLKNITAQSMHIIKANTPIHNASQDPCGGNPISTNFEPSESNEIVPELEPTKTVTLIRENEKNSRKHIRKHKGSTEHEHQKTTIEVIQSAVRNQCPCAACFKDECSMKTIKEQQSDRILKSDQACKSKTTLTCSDKETETSNKLSRFQVQKEIRVSRNKGLKITTGKPYVEIMIDRPQTEISVGIGGITMNDQVSPGRNKASRIPKRSQNIVIQPNCLTSKRTQITPSEISNFKSLIPKPRKRTSTVDDIEIKNRGTSTKNHKLNVTL